MSFIPDNVVRGKQVPGMGSKDSRICIVGDAVDKMDAVTGRPFSGATSTVLDSCLQAAGLIRPECYITTVIKTPPSYKGEGKFFTINNHGAVKFTPAGMEQVNALRAELSETKSNILVAAGPVAFAALTGRPSGLTRNRGYVTVTSGLRGGALAGGERKVIPTFAPGDTIWKNYTNRTVIAIDFKKAKLESTFPEWRRPERNLILKYDSLSECLEWLSILEAAPILAFDIEVINYEVACISFSHRPDIGVVIPILDRWTEEEECTIWLAIQRVLGNVRSIKVCQNGIFDIHFLLTRCGIEVRGPIQDTMVGHSVIYTELPKGLGFLGSIYCGSQPEWKSSVKFTDVKEES